MNFSTWLMTTLGVLAGVGLGWLLHHEWLRREAVRKQRLPARWLFSARAMVNSEEQAVWNWLRSTFADHAVMLKVPVVRFTVPSTGKRPGEKNQHWQELLEGVYCTFTVCSLGGKVVGCVDVPGKRGVSRIQREMKENLLQECGIGYTTVRSSSLPPSAAMRAAFLGEVPLSQAEAEETRGGNSSFHAALDEFSNERVRAAKAAALKDIRDKESAETEPRDQARQVGFSPDGTRPLTAAQKRKRKPSWEDSLPLPGESRPARIS